MKVVTKHNGIATDHEVETKPLTVICHDGSMKIEVPELDKFAITPETTVMRMKTMTQEEWSELWSHPIPLHFFHKVYKEKNIILPKEIKMLHDDYDAGIIHVCGLITLLMESITTNHKDIFIRKPEANLHPSLQAGLADIFIAFGNIGEYLIKNGLVEKPQIMNPKNLGESEFKLAEE